MRSFLILYCSAFAFEQRFLSEVTVYTWSHHHERTVLLTATHWPINLAMGKGTIFSVMLHPAEFPCWSRRRDQVRQHCKLGSSAPFPWPRFLHPVDRESKTASLELSNPVSHLPVLGWKVPERFSEVFPYGRLQQEKQQGSFWGAGLRSTCANPC